MSRAEISQGSLLRVFCYATVRLFIAKREAAASPISGNAVEDQGKCRAYFICDAASKGTRARRRLQPKTKHLLQLGQLGRGSYYPKSPKDGRRGSLRKRITTSGLALGAARRQACAAAKTNGFMCNTIQAKQLGTQAGSGSSSRPPPPFTSLQFAASSGWLTILTVCPRPALMCCSVRLSVMPHSAKSSARGDEISTTVS